MRLVSAMLAVILVLGIISSNSISVTTYAVSTKTYSTLDTIPEDLDTFNTIAKGTISALKVDAVWYYQFARSGYDKIRVKASAFKATSHDNAYHLDADNASLTNTVNSKPGNDTRINCYISTVKTFPSNGYKGINVYITTRCRYLLTVNGGTMDKISMKSTLKEHVTFEYWSKVAPSRLLIGMEYYSSYIAPTNAEQYLRALRRHTSNEVTITPSFELSITNTGDVGAYLSSYTLSGKGYVAKGINVSDWISIGFKTVKLGISVVAPDFTTLIDLGSLVGDITKLTKNTSGDYTTGEEPLSAKNRFTYKAKYISPIKLKNTNDYAIVITDFGSINSGYSGRGTAKVKVAFAFGQITHSFIMI